jgi:hypothetical protein
VRRTPTGRARHDSSARRVVARNSTPIILAVSLRTASADLPGGACARIHGGLPCAAPLTCRGTAPAVIVAGLARNSHRPVFNIWAACGGHLMIDSCFQVEAPRNDAMHAEPPCENCGLETWLFSTSY